MVRCNASAWFLNMDSYNELANKLVNKLAIRLDSDHDFLGGFFSFLTVTIQINVPYIWSMALKQMPFPKTGAAVSSLPWSCGILTIRVSTFIMRRITDSRKKKATGVSHAS